MTTQSRSEKELINDMVEQILEIANLNLNLKSLKDEAKEAGYDGALLATIAKAVATSKQSELAEKSQNLIALIEKL